MFFNPRVTVHYLNRRRRLLEMTVGTRFPSPSLPFSFPFLPCLFLSLPSFSPSRPPLTPVPLLMSPVFVFPFLVCTPYPLNPARGSGERCKLAQRIQAEPGRQTLFRLKSAHFLSLAFVIFYCTFGYVLHNGDKIVEK